MGCGSEFVGELSGVTRRRCWLAGLTVCLCTQLSRGPVLVSVLRQSCGRWSGGEFYLSFQKRTIGNILCIM